ncbi:MAG: glycosyltransferase family 39 protein [Acidobacteriota bacterium]|jgi:hypothetical protein
MTHAGAPAGPAPRRLPWLRIAVTLVSTGALASFLWRFPVPVTLVRAADVARSVGTAGFLLATALLAGAVLLRRLGLASLPEGPGERILLAAGLGTGSLALVSFLLGLAGGFRPLPCLLVFAAIWFWGRSALAPLAADLVRWWRGRPRSAGAADLVLRACLFVAMGLMLLEALAPPTAYDALRYHLRLPAIYAAEGRWTPVPYEFNGYFPQNVDMLFTLGFVLGAPAAAVLIHLVLGWLAAASSGLLASRLAGPPAGWAAATIFYTMPVVAINSAWAYVDLGLAFFALLSVHALARWWQTEDGRWAILSGLLAGFALGTKYTGATVLVVGCVVILGRGVGERRLPGRRLAAALLLFATSGGLVATPWLARNAVLRANPVYPFAASIFGTPSGDTYRAERHRAVLDRPEVPTRSVGDLVRLPWRLTMQPWVRDEMIGPALLVLLPLLFFTACGGSLWLLAVAVAWGLLWLVLSPQVRLYLHGLGLLAAVAAVAWTRTRARGGWFAGLASGLAMLAVPAGVANLAVIQRGLSDPFPVVVGMESPGRYLARMVDGHRAIQFINENLPGEARVLFIGEIYGYYCRRDHVLGSKFDRAPIVDWIAGSPDLPAFLDRLREERITHVLYSQVQLRKFADLPGRYLDWPDERSRRIYREFMTRWIDVVYDDPDAIVARVRHTPRPEASGEPLPS